MPSEARQKKFDVFKLLFLSIQQAAELSEAEIFWAFCSELLSRRHIEKLRQKDRKGTYIQYANVLKLL